MTVRNEDIERVARLMRINIADHAEHIERVQEMLTYFEILDKADVGGEEIPVRQVTIDSLRSDEHVAFPGSAADALHNRRGGYVRSPKVM